MGVNFKKNSHILMFALVMPLISISLAYVTSQILIGLMPKELVFLIEAAGPLGYYHLLFSNFNKSLWRYTPTWMNIIEVPNLEGRWVGKLKSSYNDKKRWYKCAVEIEQTFSEIKIFCYFARSWSRSTVANFYNEPDGKKVLHYEYYNEPYEGADKSMNAHYGASRHYYDGREMKCYYYNEPEHDRGNHGNFTIKLEQKKLRKKL